MAKALLNIFKLLLVFIFTVPFVVLGFIVGFAVEAFLVGKYWGDKFLVEATKQ